MKQLLTIFSLACLASCATAPREQTTPTAHTVERDPRTKRVEPYVPTMKYRPR